MTTAVDPLRQARTEYDRAGWYRSPRRLGEEGCAKLRASIRRISAELRPEVVYEKGTSAVRAVHGCHRYDPVCADLVRLPWLVELAAALVGGPVYVYQFKVNIKQPREGAAWPWHQDYAFWSAEDGMPAARAVNIAIFLDDAHERNGPLVLVPGSHRLGLLDPPAGGARHGAVRHGAARHGAALQGAARRGDAWRDHVSADLPYTVPGRTAERLAREAGKVLMVGPAGSVYAFHPSVVHSSAENRSADRRALVLITYNAVDNAPANPTRPAFLVDRETSPVVTLDRHHL